MRRLSFDADTGLRNRASIAIALAAGAVFALALGLRLSQPLFISALNAHTGIGYATISLAFGVAQLTWGIAQPVAGAIADQWGPRRVMVAGAVLLAAANAAAPFAGNAVMLTLLIGVAAAAGAGALGPAMLIATANRFVPEAKRSMTSGIINAGGSFGQFTMVPLAALLMAVIGWQPAMIILGATTLAAVPLVMLFTPPSAAPARSSSAGGTLAHALRSALLDRSFLLLNAGFFTCGFHIAFLSTHLPGVVALCGLPASVSAWTLSVIGLFNIFGSLLIGQAIQRQRMKFALAAIYLARAMLIAAFVLAPKTSATFLLFGAGIGVTYLSTVPPTVGLVAKLLGVRYLATLFGVVMLSHQIGGFIGAWLGGRVFEATGSYDSMWLVDIALCLFAAVVHMPIREARLVAVGVRA